MPHRPCAKGMQALQECELSPLHGPPPEACNAWGLSAHSPGLGWALRGAAVTGLDMTWAMLMPRPGGECEPLPPSWGCPQPGSPKAQVC